MCVCSKCNLERIICFIWISYELHYIHAAIMYDMLITISHRSTTQNIILCFISVN